MSNVSFLPSVSARAVVARVWVKWMDAYDSPYGKLVQKGHARMFYNVSDISHPYSIQFCAFKTSHHVSSSPSISAESEHPVLMFRITSATPPTPHSPTSPNPSDPSTRPPPTPTRPSRRPSSPTLVNTTNPPSYLDQAVCCVAVTCTRPVCMDSWRVCLRLSRRVWQ